MANTKAVGDVSHAMVMAAFIKAGMTVLLPFGDNQRYDLVVEQDGRFIRIQCKTAHVVDECAEFKTCSTYAHRGRGPRDYKGQADFFGVHCPSNDRVYLVPVDVVGGSAARLRLSPAKNNQSKGVRWASEYEFSGKFSVLAPK